MNRPLLFSGVVVLWAVFSLIGLFDVLGGLTFSQSASVEASRSNVVPNSSAPQPFEELHNPLVPAQLVIPKLGIHTTVEPVGLNIKGNMTVPSSYQTVSWYKPGSRAGEEGNTVIAGHLDNSLGLPGVFERLHTLSIGDTVEVKDSADRTLLYRIVSMSVYNTAEAPAAEIFSTKGPSQLVLITCNGAWDHAQKSYDKRLVVMARPVR